MPKLQLSFISAFNERVDPLMKGTVQAEGIEIVPTYSHPSETFWRQLKFQEYEVGEMSMSSYLIARERGFDIIALPVFPSRRLFHSRAFLQHRLRHQAAERSRRQTYRRGGIPTDSGSMAAGYTRTRLRRVAIQSSLVHGEDGRVEPRRGYGVYSAGGNIVPAHSAGQKHGFDAGE